MSKKQSILIILVIVVAIFGILAWAGRKTAGQNSGQTVGTKEIVLYYGDTCPHCKELSAYIDKNNIKSKVNFTEKEVFENQTNAQELLSVAKSCGLPDNNVGVPFLYANGKCIVGTDQVEAFFNDQVAQSSTSKK